MGTEQFCLRWNDFHANITSAFSDIRDDDDFMDVTLVCDGDIVRAHKLVLSACSPLFRVMLKKNSHPQPMIFLRGIRFPDMVAILNFMYHGEVNVNQEDLQMFLAAAEELRIKGLSQGSTEKVENSVPKKKLLQPSAVQPPAAKKPRESSPVAVGGGSPVSSNPGSARSPGLEPEDIEEGPQLAVKREFNQRKEDVEGDEDSQGNQNNLLDQFIQLPPQAGGGPSYGNFSGQGSNQSFEPLSFNSNSAGHLMSAGASLTPGASDKGLLGPGRGGSPAPGNMKFAPGGGLPYEMHRLGGRNEDGLAHMVVMKTFRGWHCPSCSYISPSQKGNLKVHILNRHANPGESFACMFCGKHLSSRSSLQVHISQVHREQQKAKRMLEERLKITNLEERLKCEMAAAGGQLSLENLQHGTAEALRQAMQHEDRMRAQQDMGNIAMLGGQVPRNLMNQMNQLAEQAAGFDSNPASSAGSVPPSPARGLGHQEGSPVRYSPGATGAAAGAVEEQLPQEPAHYQKEAGGDAVSVYPKDMMGEREGLVYHKQVGGHSVSIYPKDQGLQGMSESLVVYPESSMQHGGGPGQAHGGLAGPGHPVAQGD